MEHVLLRCQIAVANANSKQKDLDSKVFYYLSFLTQYEILVLLNILLQRHKDGLNIFKWIKIHRTL